MEGGQQQFACPSDLGTEPLTTRQLQITLGATMLSIERFRKLLGDAGAELTEAEVRELRAQMRVLAEVIVDAASRKLDGGSADEKSGRPSHDDGGGAN